MAKTVVGLFDTIDEAQQVVQDLADNGFERSDISLVASDAKGKYASSGKSAGTNADEAGHGAAEAAGTGAVGGTVVGGALGLLAGLGAIVIPGIGPVIAAGTLATALGSTALGAGIGAGVGAAAGGLIGALTNAGVPEEDATLYNEGVRRGGTLVMVRAQDDMAQEASDIMTRNGAVNIDERGADYRQTKFDSTSQPYSTEQMDTYRQQQVRPAATATNTNVNTNVNRTNMTEGDAVLPVVEEELQVGKRQVQGGGVRVYTHVTEKPIQEQVTLHEETVNVERRPVNRAVTDADMAAFKEGAIEVTTTSEEAVVSKQARVVEEVVVDKQATERTQTVQDTVRRTDVEVEKINPGMTASTTTTTTGTTTGQTMGFTDYDSDFRTHFQGLGQSGYTYEQYTPIYRYGYDLSNDPRYTGKDWSAVESSARQDFETRNPNSKWEQFKDSVRYAFDHGRKGMGNAANSVDNARRSM